MLVTAADTGVFSDSSSLLQIVVKVTSDGGTFSDSATSVHYQRRRAKAIKNTSVMLAVSTAISATRKQQ